MKVSAAAIIHETLDLSGMEFDVVKNRSVLSVGAYDSVSAEVGIPIIGLSEGMNERMGIGFILRVINSWSIEYGVSFDLP